MESGFKCHLSSRRRCQLDAIQGHGQIPLDCLLVVDPVHQFARCRTHGIGFNETGVPGHPIQSQYRELSSLHENSRLQARPSHKFQTTSWLSDRDKRAKDHEILLPIRRGRLGSSIGVGQSPNTVSTTMLL